MKRVLILLLALALGVGSASTAAAAKRKPARVQRTVTGHYGPYPAPVTGCNDVLTSFACMVVHTRSNEAFLTAEVTDEHGLPVYVEVHGRFGRFPGAFCGRTTEPLAVHPGDELHIYVGLPAWGLQGKCPQHSVKTTGTIRLTLSNRP